MIRFLCILSLLYFEVGKLALVVVAAADAWLLLVGLFSPSYTKLTSVFLYMLILELTSGAVCGG